jgi:ketosteroid isomerase-like protein
MQTLKITQWRAAAFISLFLLAAGSSTASSSNEQHHKLTAADESAIRAIIEAYRTAWLANDAKGVLNTFSDDGVLLPAHGAPAVVGIAAIEKYWFTPGGPPTTITELNITVDQASGNGILAYARLGRRCLDSY